MSVTNSAVAVFHTHGTPDEVEQAKGVLQSANVTTTVHGEPVVVVA